MRLLSCTSADLSINCQHMSVIRAISRKFSVFSTYDLKIFSIRNIVPTSLEMKMCVFNVSFCRLSQAGRIDVQI